MPLLSNKHHVIRHVCWHPLPEGINGVCLMRNAWKEDQRPSFIDFMSTFLSANSSLLSFVTISTDCSNNVALIFSRVHKLKTQFSRFDVVITLPRL
ncbi:hypothetical protein MTR_2g451120 [Medicago truncatula]|uniref:Uncharacterized protein n=1 Tax=Medicago truncatula TaxID=3880 RepID=G7ZWZ4_MEDTR|nr:hypothetical protein MTR_2g451120 [Medicago truncatula]